jgi:hypothetical protein
MKLKRARTLAPVSYETLAANVGYDREVHGEAINVWPPLSPHGACVCERGPSFQAWRRQAVGGVARTPAWSEEGTGMESRNG